MGLACISNECGVELMESSSTESHMSCFQTVQDNFPPGGFTEENFFRTSGEAEKSELPLFVKIIKELRDKTHHLNFSYI